MTALVLAALLLRGTTCAHARTSAHVLNRAAIQRRLMDLSGRALQFYRIRCREPVPVRCLLPTLCAIPALPPRPHC